MLFLYQNIKKHSRKLTFLIIFKKIQFGPRLRQNAKKEFGFLEKNPVSRISSKQRFGFVVMRLGVHVSRSLVSASTF